MCEIPPATPPAEFPADGRVQNAARESFSGAPATLPAHPFPAEVRIVSVARDSLCDSLVLFENRILQRIDTAVHSFNQILRAGLGEVPSKYPIFIIDIISGYHRRLHGNRFLIHRLKNNFGVDDFKCAATDFRGLGQESADNVARDGRHFLGCFDFPDEAGTDLANLVISIFKAGLFKKLTPSKFWNAKKNYLKSLQTSMRHFTHNLENEQRIVRAVGGLTSALGNLQLLFPRIVFRKRVCVCSSEVVVLTIAGFRLRHPHTGLNQHI